MSAEERTTCVRAMTQALRHRGPDDYGLASKSEATLGMRRLAIFDPAQGRQPMSTPDGRWHVVFNGAIYNFRELRRELTGVAKFDTECDTEVLLAAVSHWGVDALHRLRGMFAFAAWDAHEHALIIARDPFGIKPLYYHRPPSGDLLFASELNSLHACPRTPRDHDPHAISEYLAWLSVPAPRTIYKGVQSLKAGEYAVWRDGVFSVSNYERTSQLLIPGTDIPVVKSKEAFLRGLRAQLEDTVRAHRVADVPVGAFLSGGLDSTALVALMGQAGGSRLKTFSIGFDEAGYSEADEAAANAQYLGTDHHSHIVTGTRVAADIETILSNLDHPTGDGINTYYASQAARAGGVTAALSGLGADELFGGYPSFSQVPHLTRWLRIWRVVPKALRNALLARWDKGDTRMRKLADTLRHGDTPAALALLQRRVFSESTRCSLLAPEFAADYAPHPDSARLSAELAQADLFTVTSAAELSGYMADVLLPDSDMMSMRHSLELRVPFVDRPLVRWLAHQPLEFKHTPRQPKSALAAALRDLLPPGLTTRKKRGFTLPFPTWMRGPLKPFLDDVFSPSSVARSGFFDVRGVQSQWKQFQQGNDPTGWSRTWALGMLIAFLNRRRPTLV